MTHLPQTPKRKNEEPEDPVESMVKKTGCLEFHYKVLVRLNKLYV